jgi:hypothetical protein
MGNGQVDTMLRRRIRKKESRAGYATQYFVDDVRLRQTLDLDIGNT